MRGVTEHERFNKRRISWTIGSDGGTTYGYKPNAFGALRPHAPNKQAMSAVTVDNANVFALQSVSRAFPGVDSFQISIQEWTGNPITMTWNAGNSAYQATVAGLNAFCAARAGRALKLSVSNADVQAATQELALDVGSFLFAFGYVEGQFGSLTPVTFGGSTITQITGDTATDTCRIGFADGARLPFDTVDLGYGSGQDALLDWNEAESVYEVNDAVLANYLAVELGNSVRIELEKAT